MSNFSILLYPSSPNWSSTIPLSYLPFVLQRSSDPGLLDTKQKLHRFFLRLHRWLGLVVGHKVSEKTDWEIGDGPRRPEKGRYIQSDRHHLPSIRTNYEQQILGRYRERYRRECEQKDRKSCGEIVDQIRVLRGARARHRSKSCLS